MVAAVLTVPGCTLASAHPTPERPSVGSIAAAAVLAQLQALPVDAPFTSTRYTRAEFGQAWSDDVPVPLGHNGCDTRNDILRRDLTMVEVKAGTHGCVVLRGLLSDPYTGTSLTYLRGASVVDVDHVVSLGNAWRTGAARLTPAQRRQFANDPMNLQAAARTANRAKGEQDAAGWLPGNSGWSSTRAAQAAARCTYATRQIAVKTTYHLWVTPAERGALARVLTTDCTTTSGRTAS